MNSSSEPLPHFPYHPDPIATKCVEESNEPCACCNRQRGYLCSMPPFGEEDVDQVCPWCVSDGAAAEKFDATFNDYGEEIEGDVPESVVEEVTSRTPGFASWNYEGWQYCCNDACEFHGDVPKEELKKFKGELLEKFLFENNNMPEDYFEEFKQYYEPGGNPCVFKFVCRHCKQTHYILDFT